MKFKRSYPVELACYTVFLYCRVYVLLTSRAKYRTLWLCLRWLLELWIYKLFTAKAFKQNKFRLRYPTCTGMWLVDICAFTWIYLLTHSCHHIIACYSMNDVLWQLTLMCLLRLDDWLKLLLHSEHLWGRCFSCTCRTCIRRRSRFSNDLEVCINHIHVRNEQEFASVKRLARRSIHWGV